ncbi:hypothetical protein BD779DRAFT_273355 [Infundibulicybe gibba]|nr:hypothetical protein BD779DRAFT_273355 [Infundibulicybe gibba]
MTMVSASDANDIYLSGYLHLVAITLLYYDHFITMGMSPTSNTHPHIQLAKSEGEVKYLWRRPKRRSAYWFFLHRYFSFFMNIMTTLFKLTTSDPKVCYLPSPCANSDSKPFPELQTI